MNSDIVSEMMSLDYNNNKCDDINWRDISLLPNLREDFIDKFADKVVWYYILREQSIPEELIMKNTRYFTRACWFILSKYQILSVTFIERYLSMLDWSALSRYQKLSEAFIDKHSDKVSWGLISEYQKLSEKFIEKHSNRVYWPFIFLYQTLTESFIEKYATDNDWDAIFMKQHLSTEFINKHKSKLRQNKHLTSSCDVFINRPYYGQIQINNN